MCFLLQLAYESITVVNYNSLIRNMITVVSCNAQRLCRTELIYCNKWYLYVRSA